MKVPSGNCACAAKLVLMGHNSLADAVADLGDPEDIGRIFAGFQQYLYQEVA